MGEGQEKIKARAPALALADLFGSALAHRWTAGEQALCLSALSVSFFCSESFRDDFFASVSEAGAGFDSDEFFPAGLSGHNS